MNYKTFIALACLCLAVPVFAEETATPVSADALPPAVSADAPKSHSPFAFEIGLEESLDYGFFSLSKLAGSATVPPILEAMAQVVNLRTGVFGNAAYRLDQTFALGAELGLSAMSASITATSGGSSASIVLVDAWCNLVAPVSLGGLRLSGFGGLYANTAQFSMATLNWDAGARLSYGNFYLSYAHVATFPGAVSFFGTSSFERFAIGIDKLY
jgi:hypothetical protein